MSYFILLEIELLIYELLTIRYLAAKFSGVDLDL